MKHILTIILCLVAFKAPNNQTESAFTKGEWFKFEMSYSGFLKAGNATLSVNETNLDGKEVYHVVGKGWTTGAIKWFFKVKDRYESYFDKNTGAPYKFIRKIDEGGHTKDVEIKFNHKKRTAEVNNKKHKSLKTIATEKDVQDMVSMYYYLRNSIDVASLKIGDEIKILDKDQIRCDNIFAQINMREYQHEKEGRHAFNNALAVIGFRAGQNKNINQA